ncbi:sugar MFS transporter [Chitinophagaceae bacterium LB-8]|jgi:MFS transporter, FHS family, L-fucose permease|uniref:Sugar MFS transporter n=1 Tax=Paraflavisolibacter caeni TaxID=2982496 RepID=A0A9X2XU44_9BACT|nr:sugar MFS transporter [Paraflavisolibacter caeni]MCU7549259.1 sugar MFS transporter [Paraflavisolibacter caeni]
MQHSKSNNRYAIVIIGILFFVFGFITWLNGTLIPFLKLACELENDIQAFLVTFAFYMAYFFLALPSSLILKKTGFKNGMALGLLVMAIGSVIFIPAAQTRNFSLFLTGLFVQGAGLAILQTASNPYISIIGPIESAAQRISIMGICNKIAGMLSPIILGALVLKNASTIQEKVATATDTATKENLLNELAGRVITPYAIMAVVLVLLAFMIKRSSLPEIDTDKADANDAVYVEKKSIFQFPHLMLGVLCLFLYVGAEVMAGDAIGAYGRELGMPLDETKYFTSFTLFAMLAGYIVGIFTIPKYLSQQKALAISAILGSVFTIGVFVSEGYTAISFIALLGLANALMWPAIFPLAISGLGKFTKTGSALLVMGIAGGALIPLLYTTLKDKGILSNHTSFLVCMLPAYLYIIYYAIKGHIQRKPTTVSLNTSDKKKSYEMQETTVGN